MSQKYRNSYYGQKTIKKGQQYNQQQNAEIDITEIVLDQQDSTHQQQEKYDSNDDLPQFTHYSIHSLDEDYNQQIVNNELTNILGDKYNLLNENKCFFIKFLAKGGEGYVYEGYILKENNERKDVVFKILLDANKDEVQSEVNLMNLFDVNINIIKLFEWIKITDSIHILVLERCKYSLEKELELIENNQIEFSETKLFTMIADLFDGLLQLRIYNILHLDIKPANILVSQDGHYLYSDFGISTRYLPNQPTNVKGYTTKYASLEQINFDSQTDFSADIYSLGLTIKSIIEIFKSRKQYQDSQIIKNFIQSLEDIISQNMVKREKVDREQCYQLHQKILDLLFNCSKEQFYNEYAIKVQLIGGCYEYDENKDIPYFMNFQLYLNKNYLRYSKILKKSELAISERLDIIQSILFTLGKYKRAFKYSQESLEIKKLLYPDSHHQDLAISLDNVGNNYSKLGDNKMGLQHCLESLEMTKLLFKQNHPDIATSLDNVGRKYLQLGDYKKALQYSLESLEMRQSLFPQNHSDVAISLNNVGVIYSKLGDNKKALKYSQESLEMTKLLFPQSHPDLATSLNNLGVNYSELGDHQTGLKYGLESLEMRKLLFTGNHPDIAVSLDSVGRKYLQLGDNKKALKYSLESLEMYKQLFPQNHPDVATALGNVGRRYSELGDYKRGLKYSLESLEMKKQIFPENHPNIVISLRNVASGYDKMRQYRKSLLFLLDALEMEQQITTNVATRIDNRILLFFVRLFLIVAIDVQNSKDTKKFALRLVCLLCFIVILFFCIGFVSGQCSSYIEDYFSF